MRQGTLYVLEIDPGHERQRWFCHLDGAPAPGFDDVDAAVEWGLERAETVVIRTRGLVFYWGGNRPEGRDAGNDARRWPPSPDDRQQIDSAYYEAAAAAREDAAARELYLGERTRWLETDLHGGAGREPAYECLILSPDNSDVWIEFEAFDDEGVICGARRQGAGPRQFGSTEIVVAATAGREVEDPWVQAVCRALDRARMPSQNGRRSTLEVTVGEGEMFHVSATLNRESINRSGLDWTRMRAAPGVAGSTEPEAPAIFLGASLRDAGFFTRMARVPTDIWAVRVDGLWIENGPTGWFMVAQPVPPDRLRLVEADIPANTRFQPK